MILLGVLAVLCLAFLVLGLTVSKFLLLVLLVFAVVGFFLWLQGRRA